MNEDKKFLQKYSKPFSAIKKDALKTCPEADVISSSVQGELSSQEKQKLEAHIDLCPACFSAIEQLTQAEIEAYELEEDWTVIEKEIDRKFYNQWPAIISHDKTKSKKLINLIEQKISNFYHNFLVTNKFVYAAGIAVIIIASLYSYAYFNRGEYYQFALIEPLTESRLRGVSEHEKLFAEGMRLFTKGNYESATKHFAIYLQKKPDHFLVNFYYGLSFLFNATEGLFGYAYKFNPTKVNAGITYLNKALSLADDNMFYQEDCYWYLAKAYLMKNDKANAVKQLKQILQLPQRNLMRKEAAQQLLERFE